MRLTLGIPDLILYKELFSRTNPATSSNSLSYVIDGNMSARQCLIRSRLFGNTRENFLFFWVFFPWFDFFTDGYLS